MQRGFGVPKYCGSDEPRVLISVGDARANTHAHTHARMHAHTHTHTRARARARAHMRQKGEFVFFKIN